MISVIISKRGLTVLTLIFFGLLLVVFGWYLSSLEKLSTLKGAPVPVESIVKFNEAPYIQEEKLIISEDISDVATSDDFFVDYKDDFFVDYKLERERARAQRVEYLREVINNLNSATEVRQKAQESLIVLSRNIEKEVELENMIKAKGYKDVAIFLSDRSLTVVVSAEIMMYEEVDSITALVSAGADLNPDQIIIIPKSGLNQLR